MHRCGEAAAEEHGVGFIWWQLAARRETLRGHLTVLLRLHGGGEKSETFLATAVEPEKDRQMAAQRLTAGSELPPNESDAVLLGRGLAASMHAKSGDYLTLMSTTTTGSLNAMDVRVAGVFMSGVKEYDDRAVKMPLAGAQQLLQTKKIERLIVMLRDTDDTAAVHASLSHTLRDVEFKEWSDLASFYHQVVLLYNGIFGFLGIVVFAIVVFSVANTILMSVFERTREIGTLMAIGTPRGTVWRMFLLECIFIGLLGGALGLAAGAFAATAINHMNLMLPPPPGYTVGYALRVLLQAPTLITAFLISLITATLSSIVPALKASRLVIVD